MESCKEKNLDNMSQYPLVYIGSTPESLQNCDVPSFDKPLTINIWSHLWWRWAQ